MISISHNNILLFTALALSSVIRTNAFVKLSTTDTSKVNTELFSKKSNVPPFYGNVYGEESRLYRRTVFTHEDWKRYRSPDRFIRNLKTFTKSGIYSNIAREVVATTTVATFVVLWNAITGGYTDFEGTEHAALFADTFIGPLRLPMSPFSLSSSSLGLLLGMFTNNPICQHFASHRFSFDSDNFLIIFLS